MEQYFNRVEQELLQFKSREERLGSLFQSEDKKDISILKDRIRFFGYLIVKYKQTKNPDELYLLKRLHVQKRQLEKELYPNRFLQLLRRTFSLATEKRYANTLQQDVLVHRQKLLDAVSRSGFHIPPDKIIAHLESGIDRFTVAVSNYFNEKERMEYQLVFAKDISGDYSFDGFKASLHKENDTENFKEHFFKNEQKIFTPHQAFHLLAGRAIEKQGSWLQFDLNDRNTAGSYRIKEFRSEYGFDLKNGIEALPLKDKSAEKVDALFKALKLGESLNEVFLVKEREHSFSIQANPQFRTVDIYDEHLKKITLSSLRGSSAQRKPRKAVVVENAKQKNKRALRIN